jgi:hypothetical protein
MRVTQEPQPVPARVQDLIPPTAVSFSSAMLWQMAPLVTL